MRNTEIADINQLLLELAKDPGPSQIIYDARFLKPYHLALIAHKYSILKPSLNAQLDYLAYDKRQYASRMHLYDHICDSNPYPVNEYDPFGKFIPLAPINVINDVFVNAAHASNILFNSSSISNCKLSKDSIKNALLEIMNNCFDHGFGATSKVGFIVGQTWSEGNLAQLCICDNGIGIRKSLTKNASLTTRLAKENACQLATEFRITSDTSGGHSGYGVTIINELMKQIEGNLVILSQNEYYQAIGRTTDAGSLLTPFDGTMIMFEWNLGATLSIDQVYESLNLKVDDFELETI